MTPASVADHAMTAVAEAEAFRETGAMARRAVSASPSTDKASARVKVSAAPAPELVPAHRVVEIVVMTAVAVVASVIVVPRVAMIAAHAHRSKTMAHVPFPASAFTLNLKPKPQKRWQL